MTTNAVYTDSGITNKIARSENILHAVMNKCEISPQGQDFIDIYVDPSKDLGGIKCAGYPDASNRNVTVHHIKRSVTVSAPFGILPTDTWACHAFQGPLASPHTIINAVQTRANFITQTRTSSNIIGGLTILNDITGASSNRLGYGNRISNIAAPIDFFLNSNARVIYQAHQCRNITPELYQSGTVMTYRKTEVPLSETTFEASLWNPVATPAPTGYGSMSFKFLETDVGEYSDLLQLPGSKQWEAKKGHYCVGSTCSMEQPVGTDKAEAILFKDTRLESTSGNNASRWMSETSPYVPIPNYDVEFLGNLPSGVFNQPFITNFNTSGAYYTGLSPQTVLVFTAIFGIEEAPNSLDTKMTSLAHISPCYDPCALELMSKLNHVMPSGVPVEDNGTGDYLGFIADLASMVGVPGSAFLQSSAKSIGNSIDGWLGIGSANSWSKPTNPRQLKNVSKQINTKSKTPNKYMNLPPPRLPRRTAANFPPKKKNTSKQKKKNSKR